MKNKMTLLLSILVFALMHTVGNAQEKIVTGTVTDVSSIPLPGVNVIGKDQVEEQVRILTETIAFL